MNRRQKIIVSVVGIFIVLLALVGITYGYFLTRIQGNTNTTSITVTTADLKLVYGDGNEDIESASVLMPGEDFKFIGRDAQGNVLTDANGDIIEYDSKTFSVTNDGNTTVEDYAVVLEDISVTYASNATLEDGTTVTAGQSTTFERPQDFVYSITCVDNNENPCNGQSLFTRLPMQNAILITNDIEEGVTHNYELKIKYLDPNVDQSKDMNKTLKMKLNISDYRAINPYSNDEKSLANNIINNALLSKNGTTLSALSDRNIGDTKIEKVKSIKYIRELETRALTVDEIDGSEHWMWYYGEGEDAYEVFNGGPDMLNGTKLKQGSSYNDYVSNGDSKKYIYAMSGKIGKPFYLNSYDETTGEKIVTFVEGETSLTINYESVLSSTNDDYGTSYYYRGNVEDNYVNFAGMCWRIVRIQGDGSTKLILEDQFAECDDTESTPKNDDTIYYTGNFIYDTGNFGYNSGDYQLDYYGTTVSPYTERYLTPTHEKESAMVNILKNFQTEKLKDYTGFLKSGDWCLNDAYESNNVDMTIDMPLTQEEKGKNYITNGDIYRPTNISQTQLKCYGKVLTNYDDNENGIMETSETPMYVGTINVKEVNYAGRSSDYVIGSNEEEFKFYLKNGKYNSFTTMSLNYYSYPMHDKVYHVSGGTLSGNNQSVESELPVRPMIIIKNGIDITDGTGIKTDPYVIG